MIVSVIIPVFNSRNYLRSTVLSVLNQPISNLEIIIVDDASTDGSAETVIDLPVKIHSIEAQKGPAFARNYGLAKAQGSYISFLDHDDIIAENSLADRAKWLIENPCKNIIGYTNVGFIDAIGTRLVELEKSYNGHKKKFETYSVKTASHANGFESTVYSYVYTKELIEKVGSFDESLKSADDLDFLLRCAKEEEISCFSKMSVFRRIHGSNFSSIVDPSGKKLVRKNRRHAVESLMVRLAHGASSFELLNKY